ncbi:MAG: PHP domain-containing protein [Chloroflexota bacterium]|nr:PHP domain-containing protein [Chloroflexota bacterium]
MTGSDTQRWKLDLHAHTWHSQDSPVSPERLVRAAKRRGLDGIAITNHGRFAGHDTAQAAGGPDFRVIPGEEVYTTAGEIIGLFLREEIPNGLSPEETCAAIRAQGGIVVIPHPFDRYRKGAIGEAALDRLVGAGLVDAIEVFNGRMVAPMDNWAAKTYAAAHHVPMTVGSDAHGTWEYGGSFIEIAPFTDAASFLANLPGATLHPHRSAQWVHLISSFAKKRRKRRTDSHDSKAEETVGGDHAPAVAAGKERAR